MQNYIETLKWLMLFIYWGGLTSSNKINGYHEEVALELSMNMKKVNE